MAFSVFCIYSTFPALAGSADSQTSASIQASATVINPVGMTSTDAIYVPKSSISELGVSVHHSALANSFLVRFPADGSLLLMLETDGQVHYSVVFGDNCREKSPPAAMAATKSGLSLVRQDDILEAVPSGCSECVITLVCTEN